MSLRDLHIIKTGSKVKLDEINPARAPAFAKNWSRWISSRHRCRMSCVG